MIPYFTLYYIAFGWGALSAMSQLVLVYHLACIELNPCMPQRLIDIALQVNLRQRYEEKSSTLEKMAKNGQKIKCT